METKTVWKLWFVWDFDKEERWLNEMAMKGWKLVKVRLCWFTFEKCEEGEMIVRMEMNRKDNDYIEFIEEMGATYVGHCGGWRYYSRPAVLGSFVLNGTISEKVRHLERILRVLKPICFANIAIGLTNTFTSVNAGWINLLCAALLSYAWGRIEGKKDMLMSEKGILE